MPAGMAMPGMNVPDGGLASSADGFTLVMLTPVLAAGQPGLLRFQVTAAGKPVTTFMPDQTKLMHLYLIRSDLTGFQHVHPVMAPGGTWTVRLAAHEPGSYRVFAAFTASTAAGKPVPLVLSAPVMVPGTAAATRLPPPSGKAIADGYTLLLGGTAMAGMGAHPERHDHPGRQAGDRLAALPGQLRAPDRVPTGHPRVRAPAPGTSRRR